MAFRATSEELNILSYYLPVETIEQALIKFSREVIYRENYIADEYLNFRGSNEDWFINNIKVIVKKVDDYVEIAEEPTPLFVSGDKINADNLSSVESTQEKSAEESNSTPDNTAVGPTDSTSETSEEQE